MLSIILINYHAAQLVTDCLQTVYADKGSSRFEVIVVDNSPGDGAKEQILAKYADVQWLSTGYNAGFARANNAGIKATMGDAVLLLNPDTLIQGSAISESYEFLMQSKFAGCGVQLLNADRTPQISGNFAMKGGMNYLMQVPYIGRVLRWLALSGGVSKTNLPKATKAVTEVDWINGAFLMAKRSAIETAGLLDEDFFLYHEESEWCSRLKNAGKLCILGNQHVVHLEGQSANKAFTSATAGYSNLSDKKGYQLMLSMFVRFRKEFGIGWFLFHLFFFTASIPVILLCACIDCILHFSIQPLKAAIGFTTNVLRCWQFAFLIIANKPYFYNVLIKK